MLRILLRPAKEQLNQQPRRKMYQESVWKLILDNYIITLAQISLTAPPAEKARIIIIPGLYALRISTLITLLLRNQQRQGKSTNRSRHESCF
jgi:hypothetical protein